MPTEPKIQAILDVIRTVKDRAGNIYYAFRYTRCQDGKQVRATISGGESNISCAKGLAGLCPSENVYYTYHDMGYQDFARLTKDWPYAGCPPQAIAQFIVTGLAATHYEDPILSVDKASKTFALFNGFDLLQDFQPYSREEDAVLNAAAFFGPYNQFETKYPKVTKMRFA